MRYEKGHRETSRARILDVAAKRFRKDGVAAVGLAGVMADAGLTNGAFYVHFQSKEELLQEVLASTLDQRRESILKAIEGGEAGLKAALRNYLSAGHRDKPENGCPTSSLAPEIARHPRATRALYTARIQEFVALIAAQFKDPDEHTRNQQATALFGLLVGTVQLSRAVSNKAMSESILEGGLNAALLMLKTAMSPPSSPA